MEQELKQTVQKNVKRALIESKYADEPISFGQAMVTYHYVQNQPIRAEFPENQLPQRRPQTAAGRATVKMSPAKQVLQQMESQRSDRNVSGSPSAVKTVQWDMIEKQFKDTFARRTVRTNEFSNVSEALQLQRYDPIQRDELAELKWETLPGREPYNKRYPRGHCRSITPPTHWQTENRDKFRTFIESPTKEDLEFAQPVVSNENYIVHDGQNEDLAGVDDQEAQNAPLNTTERRQGKTVQIAADLQSETTKKTLPKKVLTPAQKKAEKELKKRRSDFLNTTRWLADSSFTTYFGKPPFHAYGKGNVNPTVGGVNYGQNLLTHNINAECGDHPPLYQQVYDSALKSGLKKTKGMRVPDIPMTKAQKVVTDEELAEMKAQRPIMPNTRRSLIKKKGEEQGKLKASIRIAKPEMTLQGFKHTATTMSRKQAMEKEFDGKSQDGCLSSSRRSKSRASHVSYEDLHNPPSEASQPREGFQVIDPNELPPLNQELDDESQDQEGGALTPPEAAPQNAAEVSTALPAGCDPVLLNPKNYSFVPSQWTQVIRPAGRVTVKSEAVRRVIIGVDD